MTGSEFSLSGRAKEPSRGALQTDPLLEAMRPQTTGNTLIVFDPDADQAQIEKSLRAVMGFAQSSRRSIGPFVQLEFGLDRRPSAKPDISRGTIRVLPRTGVAIVQLKPGVEIEGLDETFAAADGVLEVRPEYYLYGLQSFADTADSTWGLKATGADLSTYTGKGVKLAVLDTGLDQGHPDFAGRTVVGRNFVGGSGTDDVQGHGTHCAGVAVGPRGKGRLAPGYGCAPDAELYVGKVLNDSGSATEGSVAAGIEWAVEAGCDIVSMSLGRPVRAGEAPTLFYETLGRRALASGCLLIAAAGNSSRRNSGFIAPVGEPANSPSFMAVAALDANLDIAYFSSGGINPSGGDVDIAAPGVSVFSSFPHPRLYETLSGTSMACPHVAGIAALWAESDATLRGKALWGALTANAKALPLPARDVGAGLVQAPSAGRPGEAAIA